MRNKGAFERTGEISREVTKKSNWLEDFAERLALDEATAQTRVKVAKTAVEVARDRQQHQPSIYEMMSSIISGNKPKHSSVEEAVKDYQNRTGLAQYLKAQSDENIKDLAFQVAQAAEEECEGKFDADDEPEKDEPEEGALAEIIELFKSDDGDDDPDPAPGVEGTLLEVPKLEEAANNDGGSADFGGNPFVMAGLMEGALFSADEIKKKVKRL